MELTKVKFFSGTPLLGRLLALPTNIRLGWKDLSGTNPLNLLPKLVIYVSNFLNKIGTEVSIDRPCKKSLLETNALAYYTNTPTYIFIAKT